MTHSVEADLIKMICSPYRATSFTYTLCPLWELSNVLINQPKKWLQIYKNHVLFGAPDRYFYCLNESTGKLIWRYKTYEGWTYDYGIAGGAAA